MLQLIVNWNRDYTESEGETLPGDKGYSLFGDFLWKDLLATMTEMKATLSAKDFDQVLEAYISELPDRAATIRCRHERVWGIFFIVRCNWRLGEAASTACLCQMNFHVF